MAKKLQVDETLLREGFKIFDQISNFQPFSSISFWMTDQVLQALRETRRLTDWGMAKNKSKLKETALEIIDQILLVPEGDPVNLNLDEYQLKSMEEVSSLLQRAQEEKMDGLTVSSVWGI